MKHNIIPKALRWMAAAGLCLAVAACSKDDITPEPAPQQGTSPHDERWQSIRSAAVFFWPLVSFSAHNHRAPPFTATRPTAISSAPLPVPRPSPRLPPPSYAPTDHHSLPPLRCPDRPPATTVRPDYFVPGEPQKTKQTVTVSLPQTFRSP